MKPKICIGVPQPETTNHWFQECLWNLILLNCNDVDICRFNAVGSVIAKNRNRIVEFAKEANATHLLLIDADTTFPTSALTRLLAHDLPIVGATTCDRTGVNSRPLCEPIHRAAVLAENPVIPVKLMGFPFMLIKMEVFGKLRTPYFADPPRWMMEEKFPPFESSLVALPELVAEDEYFCITARTAGFEVFCDMSLSMEIGHIGSVIHHIK